MTRKAGHRLLLTLLSLCLCFSSSVEARPKIGLALGGGGARGLAHLGVLRWFEEHRIPIDKLSGTSMGGLVGGAYASGMDAEAMAGLIHGVDWDLTFLGDTPYALKDFRRKEDRREYQVGLELGLRGGVKLPTSLDPGHQVGLLLSRIALAYSSLASFDELPIPLRVVAVDLESGDALVLGDGSLSQALRATMAIPGIFSPVERQDRLLVDGGLLNNVPADVVREMGAEVVIAVDVGASLVKRDQLDSAISQLNQAVDVMIRDNTRQVLEEADLVISPPLQDFSAGDWRKSRAIAEVGYQACESMASQLEKYALNEAGWRQHLAARKARQRQWETLRPSFISVEGVESADERARVLARLRRHLGSPLDLDSLELDLTALTGSGRYQSLSYATARRGGQTGLIIRAQPKDYGPPFVRFSLDIANEETDVDFTFGARITTFDWGLDRAELRTDFSLGEDLGIETEYYLPIGGSGFFLAPRGVAARGTEKFRREDVLTASFRSSRFGGGLDVGVAFGRFSELRLGVASARREFELDAGQGIFPDIEGLESLARLRWVVDAQNDPIVPERGFRSLLAVDWFFETPADQKEFGKAELRTSSFLPLSEKNRLFFLGDLGTTFGNRVPGIYQFTLGGPFRLGAFDVDEFRGDNYFLASLGYLRRMGRLPDFVGQEIYLTGFAESGSVFEEPEDITSSRVYASFGGGLVLETALGPFFLGAGVGDDGSGKIYFSLGTLFR